MLHGGGGTGAIWESTQDGGPGWQYMFVQNGFNVNLSDAVRARQGLGHSSRK